MPPIKTTNSQLLWKNKDTRTTIVILLITIVYGSILLMIGYTNTGVASITGLSTKSAPLLVIPELVALYIGTIAVQFFIKRFKVHYLIAGAMLLTLISLVLLSQLDYITKTNGNINNLSAANKRDALIIFCVLNFTTGLGVSVASPISNTFFNTHFHGHDATKKVSINNALFCFGAGIIPLVFAKTIFQNQASLNFDAIRYFFYIAVGLAAVGVIVPFLMDHHLKFWKDPSNIDQHEKPKASPNQDSSSPNPTIAKHKIMKKHLFVKLLSIASLFFVFYVVVESIFNYNFVFLFEQSNNVADQIIFTQAFGLYFVVQGLMRFLSGVLFSRYVAHRWFITMSIMFIITAASLLIANIAKSNLNYAFIIAVIAGIGIGNIWPLLLNYTANFYKPKASLISLWSVSISKLPIPLVQIMIWLINFQPQSTLILSIIALVGIILVLIIIWLFTNYLTLAGFPHEDLQHKMFSKKLSPKSTKGQ